MIVRLLVVAVVALTLASCGGDDNGDSSTSPTPSAGTAVTSLTPTPTLGTFIYPTSSVADERVVALLDSGHTAANGQITGGVMLHNRNRSEAVAVPYSLELIFPDDAREDLGSKTVVLLPDQRLGSSFYTTYDETAHPAIRTVKISLDLSAARWVAFDDPNRLEVEVTVSDEESVAGTLENPYDFDTGPLLQTVLGFNSAGKIVSGAEYEFDSLGPHESIAQVEVTIPPVPGGPNPVRGETYISFAGDFPPWMTQ